LQKTLNLYAQQDEYCTDTQTQQQRILENQQRLNTEIQKQNNIQTAKSSNADSKAITQATRQLAKYEQQLNHIQMTYDSKANNDLEKPVTNAKDLNELETKRLEIETKINNLKGQKRDSSTEQEFLEVEKLLKEYQEIAAYKKKANNPTTGQLGGKSTEVASAEEVAKYDALIEKARKYGTITDETIAKLEELRAKLVSVDSSGTKTYNDDSSVYYSARDDRTVYTAEIKSATSLLEQQENSLQRILKLRTDIKTAESNGQNTTALKQELATEQAIHKSLGEQLSVYDNIISNEKRRAEALQTVATYESNLSKVQGKNETDTGLEKSKQKYQEIIALINQYKEVGTRVNGNKALEGDVEDLERLDNKISEVLSEALNAGTLLPNHINKINESINNVSHSLDTVQRKTEQTSTNSMFSSWESSLEKFQNKLNTFKIKPDDEHIFDSWKQKLIDLQKQIDEYKTAIQDIQKNDGIVSPAEEKRVKNLEKDLENTIKQMEKGVTLGERGWTDDGVSKMAEKLNKYLQENTRMSKEAKAAIQKYYNQLVSGNPTKPLKEIDAECLTIIQHEREAGRAGKSWLDILKDKAFYNNISQIVSMYFSVYSIINKLGETVETVRELDTALTEMRKVSDETVSSLKAFQQTTFEIADDIGTTALELQDATASYMRLGESLEQASESAKDTTILLNVSEFDNIDDATESLIAMSQAYTDLDKMDIINKLNQVGNNYSISTDEAASALQKSASALKTAGNSMDEALALVTAGNAVVQDADSVGAGMRTIALRLVGTSEGKEQLEELGEDTEGYIESVSKLRDTIKDATKAAAGGEGFDILDANGNYKSTYEIMEGLSDLYDDIVKKDKELGTNNLNLLLETIAGEIFAREMIEIHFQRTYLTALIA
jgi:TP901 family phage tail tape measure protein